MSYSEIVSEMYVKRNIKVFHGNNKQSGIHNRFFATHNSNLHLNHEHTIQFNIRKQYTSKSESSNQSARESDYAIVNQFFICSPSSEVITVLCDEQIPISSM